MHNISNLFCFGTTIYMFWTVPPSIIRSPRPYIEHKAYVIQVLWLLASGNIPASKQPQKLYDIRLMLYVRSWTPGDGRRNHPKHVVSFQNKINLRYCAFCWFYCRNILCRMFLYTTNGVVTQYRVAIKSPYPKLSTMWICRCMPYTTGTQCNSKVVWGNTLSGTCAWIACLKESNKLTLKSRCLTFANELSTVNMNQRYYACHTLLDTYPNTAACAKGQFTNECAINCSTCNRNVVFWATEKLQFIVRLKYNPPHVMLHTGTTSGHFSSTYSCIVYKNDIDAVNTTLLRQKNVIKMCGCSITE
jgi:hypothetical protein